MIKVMVKHVLIIIVILASVLQQHARAEQGQFYGGSMSYKMDKQANGTNMVTIELITGWVLGKGPCGPGCSRRDIGRSTRSTRPLMTRTYLDYLGNYTSDYVNRSTGKWETRDMNALVLSTYNETVIAVSEHEKWEQDILHFSFIMPTGTEKLHINFDGEYWRKNFTLQRGTVRWHLQTRVSAAVRSDTGKTNQSPRSFAKPFYRQGISLREYLFA
ncbi:uncharacterized protein LOC128556142 [Mercenaria mercenaria]|uniref:uncharacterized protein LOC128556142 n=1 Tax=Mercenaria mercenaria TaxID=6596 RepID=UPI00234ECD58|nr:uncharacterized protein LOC128556142 [Mercenaria mercenaria]